MTSSELRSIPTYTAVSYTWATEDGDATKSQIIYLDAGTTLKVTVNCETALKQLRQSHRDRVLWIDSICIDQTSIYERNHQVSLMDRIYKSAIRVEICISDPGRSYKGALKMLAEEDVTRCNLGHLKVQEFELHPWVAELSSLFRRRYFNRVWVSRPY